MYLYFNSKGVLEEVVNDLPTRKDSSNVNHIYVYIDGVNYDTNDEYYPLPSTITELSTKYQLPDGTITPTALVNDKVRLSIPYDKHRDMKCFKDFYNYEFFDIALPSGVNEDGSESEIPNVLGQSGLVALTIITQPQSLALGLVVFNVEEEVGITTDNLITEAQFNYIINYISKYTSQINTINSVIPVGTTPTNKLTNITNVKELITANIPIFDSSTIWTKDFISKVAKVGYALYLPNDTMLNVVNVGTNEIEIQVFNSDTLTSTSYVINADETLLQATSYNHKLVETISGRIPNVTHVIELNDAANKAFVVEQISNVQTEIESVGQYSQSIQQELNELQASLYGYVFGEDTASLLSVDTAALPEMINSNNVAYNTRLALNSIEGQTIKWAQYVNYSRYKNNQTISGVTFTFNKASGSIRAQGTATEDISSYIQIDGVVPDFNPKDMIYLKGCPSGGSTDKYWLEWGQTSMKDTGTGNYVQFSSLGSYTDTKGLYVNLTIHIKSGVTINTTFYPQLYNVSRIYGYGKEPADKTAFDKDYPFRIYPYGLNNIISTKVNGIKIKAGYRNLIKNALAIISNATKNGVTFTVDKTNGTITCSGTASADTTFYCGYAEYKITDFGINNTSIKLFIRGCPTGGSTSTYSLRNDWAGGFDVGNGSISTLLERNPNATISLSATIMIASGTVCNNLVFKPQFINLNDVYENPSQVTLQQFNQDFPDIENIPYEDTTITIPEQELYGINTARDRLEIVKSGDSYLLQKVQKIGSVDLGTLSWNIGTTATEDKMWYSAEFRNKIVNSNSYNIVPNMLNKKYITMASANIVNATYNKTISNAGGNNYIVIRDTTYTTAADLKTSLAGQMVYYELKNPITTTLATLTKNQVTALFAKGYCVQVLGNDDNAYAVRPDVKLDMAIKLIGGGTNE